MGTESNLGGVVGLDGGRVGGGGGVLYLLLHCQHLIGPALRWAVT